MNTRWVIVRYVSMRLASPLVAIVYATMRQVVTSVETLNVAKYMVRQPGDTLQMGSRPSSRRRFFRSRPFAFFPEAPPRSPRLAMLSRAPRTVGARREIRRARHA